MLCLLKYTVNTKSGSRLSTCLKHSGIIVITKSVCLSFSYSNLLSIDNASRSSRRIINAQRRIINARQRLWLVRPSCWLWVFHGLSISRGCCWTYRPTWSGSIERKHLVATDVCRVLNEEDMEYSKRKGATQFYPAAAAAQRHWPTSNDRLTTPSTHLEHRPTTPQTHFEHQPTTPQIHLERRTDNATDPPRTTDR